MTDDRNASAEECRRALRRGVTIVPRDRIEDRRPADRVLRRGNRATVALPADRVRVDYEPARDSLQGHHRMMRTEGLGEEVATVLRTAGYRVRRKPCRRTQDWDIDRYGTAAVRDHHWKRRYEALLDEIGSDVELVARAEDGEWRAAASIGDTESTSSASWETEADTVTAIEEDDGTLRREVIDGLFSSGRCRGCDELVPVLGDYVQYDPAGVLRCRGCQESETGDQEAGAAVIHP